MNAIETVGVLLMSFGSAASAEEVPEYLSRVRGGRPVPPELVAEFQRRYRIIGGSPLNRITQEQAATLETLLNSRAPAGQSFRVGIGMRHAPPSIAGGLRSLAETGARRIVCIIMSPQYSPFFMSGYETSVDEARRSLPAGTRVSVAGAWHDLPEFIAALATRLREALERFPASERALVPVILTVHSLPLAMVQGEPGYLEQLRWTAHAVASRAGLSPSQWQQAYQSAGHSPEEWLKPDFKELLPGLREKDHRSVLVVPVQFLADHLETLYDVGIAGRQEAEDAGMKFERIESLNCMPEFIEALAAVVRRELKATSTITA